MRFFGATVVLRYLQASQCRCPPYNLKHVRMVRIRAGIERFSLSLEAWCRGPALLPALFFLLIAGLVDFFWSILTILCRHSQGMSILLILSASP